MKPSIEIASKIALVFEVSLDYLVGNSSIEVKDKEMIKRIENITKMPKDKKTELLMLWMLILGILKPNRLINNIRIP